MRQHTSSDKPLVLRHNYTFLKITYMNPTLQYKQNFIHLNRNLQNIYTIYNNANVFIHLLKKTYIISKIYDKLHKIKHIHQQNFRQKETSA